MRKVSFLLLIAFLAQTFVYAQNRIPFNEYGTGLCKAKELPKAKEFSQAKSINAVGDVFWEESFDAGVMPNGWTTVDQTGNDFIWIVTDQPPGGQYSATIPVIASTSGGYFAQLRGDFYNTPIPAGGAISMDSYIQTGPIDCSGQPGITLEFEQFLRYCCSDETPFQVGVSTDQLNWTYYEVTGTTAINALSSNPEVVEVNISSVAGNQPQVYLRFLMMSSSHYFWMIDDIKLKVAPQNNMKLVTPFSSYYYLFSDNWYYNTMTPKDQAWFYNFAASVENKGVADQHNVSLNVKVENGTGVYYDYTYDSLGIFETTTIDTLISDSTFYPYLLRGDYTIAYTVSADESDEVPSNNSDTIWMSITDTTYAHDDGTIDTYCGPFRDGGSDGDMVGAAYFLPADDTLGSISVFIANHTAPGTSIIGQIWKYDATLSEYLLIIDSEEHTITAEDVNSWITLDLTEDEQGQRIVTSDDYYAMIECYFGTDTLYIGADYSRSPLHDYQLETWYQEGTNNYYISKNPMVRLNLRRSVKVCDPIFAEVTASNVTCVGANDGTAEVDYVGGSDLPIIAWSTGDTAISVAGLTAGDYSVTITNCSSFQPEDTVINFTILEPTVVLNLTEATLNPTCLNNDGEIDLTITGGVTPYTVQWSNGAMTEDLTGLSVGSYTYNMFDAYGCGFTGTIDFVMPSSPQIQPFAPGDTAHCSSFFVHDGYIDITVTGGNPPFTYSWSNGETTEDIDSLGKGLYTINIVDSLNCTTSTSVFIVAPVIDSCQLEAILIDTTDVICIGGSDGTATIQVTTPYDPFTFAWDNGETDSVAVMLDGGPHECVVEDFSGCQVVVSVTINDGDDLIITPTISDETVPYNGEISLAITNGTSPYTFVWSVPDSVGQNLSGLAGDAWYSVTVYDADGCSKTGSFYVGQDPVCVIAIDTILINEPLCYNQYNGGAEVVLVDGYAPYTTQWSNGETTAISHYMNAGNYCVTITDYFGCDVTGCFTVTQPAALTLSGVTTVDTLGANTGTVDITVGGGTTPYAYTWTGGATTEDLSGLAGGTYSVTVADANNCKKYGTYVVSTIDTTCTVSIDSMYIIDVACFGGTDGEVTVFASGNAGDFTYTLGGVDYATSTITGLVANTYQLIVSDTVCQSETSVTIIEPDEISLVGSTTADVDGMNTGTVSITVSGGTLPYSFDWDNGSTDEDLTGLAAGTYAVIVSDANACVADTVEFTVALQITCNLSISTATSDVLCYSGASGIANVTVTNGTEPYTVTWNGTAGDLSDSSLVAGQYIIQVTDANMCTDKDTIVIGQPTAAITITYVADSADFQTANGSINITVTGGTSPYSYLWPNGATTEDATGLIGGQSYVVTVTDTNGCVKTRSAFLPERELVCDLEGTTTVVNDCFGLGDGMAYVSATTTQGTLNYSWTNGQSNDTISGLVAGSYNVTVTDDFCYIVVAAVVSTPDTVLTVEETINNIMCFGSQNGSIDLNIYGGTSPYSVVWSNGGSDESISGLATGTYDVTVADAEMCEVIIEGMVITQPQIPTINYSVVNSTDCQNPDGSISLSISGGTSPYTYLWTTGATTSQISGLGDQDTAYYSITITDAHMCQYTVNNIAVTCPLAIGENGQKELINIYPNPTSGMLNIENAQGTTVVVYDLLGKEIERVKVTTTMTHLDMSRHPYGTYLVRISADDFVVTKRIIRSR